VLPIASIGFDSRLLMFDDASASARPILWAVAFNRIIQSPLGIGSQNFAESNSAGGIEFAESSLALISLESHNYLINMTLYYGVPGLVVLIVFLSMILRRAGRLLRHPDPKISCIGHISITAFVATLVNSVAHNTGPLNGEPGMIVVWASLGAALIYIHLAKPLGTVPAALRSPMRLAESSRE